MLFELDPVRLELRHNGQAVELRPQAARMLALLVRRAGRLVTNAEIRQALWGDQELGWRNSLHRCVRDLRCALGDDARRPRFVETVARRGYRFVGVCASVDHASTTPGPTRGWRGPFRHRGVVFAAGFTSALLLPLVFLIWCSVFAS